MSKISEIRERPAPPVRWAISMRLLLALAFGGLVAMSVGVVLAFMVGANFVNTYSLLNASAIRLIQGMETRINEEAKHAARAAETVARLYGEGKIGLEDTPDRAIMLETLLHSDPTVEGMFIFSGPSSSTVVSTALFRNPEGAIGPPPPDFVGAGDLARRYPLDAARATGQVVWGEPTVMGRTLFHSAALRLVRDGKVQGVVVAVIGQQSINRIMAELGRENDATVFLLAGSDRVIGHSRRPDVFRDGNRSIPLAEFADPVLQKLPQTRAVDDFDLAGNSGIKVTVTPDGRDGHFFLTKQLNVLSKEPYTLGVYFTKADISQEISRTRGSMLIGLAGLLLAVLAAIRIGRHIARPATKVAEVANLFSGFRLEEIGELPRSRIREIDNQAVALNKMRLAMENFTRYVPRALVARLMDSGEEANRPVEREVTIMFTDICAFTTYSEHLGASEVARVLNAHFEMVTQHVESTNGTIDKFMGDGVMAFWGAPDADNAHAAHAIAAAAAIERSIKDDNERRRARGEPPLRLRIGIHTGRVIVGNIGGTSRQNYTIVGDAVNVAQRLEQLGKELMDPEDEVIVLASLAVTSSIGSVRGFLPVGNHTVRGREKPIAVFTLEQSPGARKDNLVPFPASGNSPRLA